MKILSNKKGVGSAVGVILIILGVLFAGGVIYAVVQSGTGVGEDGDICGNCENAPYFTLFGVNATSVGDVLPTATYYHTLNGVYRGVLTSGSSGTTFSCNDQVQILADIGDHLDKDLGTYKVEKCASNDVNYQLYGSDDGTFSVWNSAGVAVTDSLEGATNQSASDTPILQTIQLVSTADDSIDPTWIVIEASNTSQVDKIGLSALSTWLTITPEDVPEFKTDENTTVTSITKAFRVSGLKPNGAVNEMSLRLDPESGDTMLTVAIYINGYTEQAFVDRDGTIVEGIEDSDGNEKHEDSWDFDYLIFSS